MADPAALVEALHRAVLASIGSRARIAIAWSGGLASTLVAAVARKHAEVVCYCAGRAGSRDRRTAREGARVLDFPLVELDTRPRTSADAIAEVRAAAREDLVVTGETSLSGPPRRIPGVARPLRSADVRRAIGGHRGSLAAAARFLALPEAIAAARHRGPRA